MKGFDLCKEMPLEMIVSRFSEGGKNSLELLNNTCHQIYTKEPNPPIPYCPDQKILQYEFNQLLHLNSII
jgi:hypothetical protein